MKGEGVIQFQLEMVDAELNQRILDGQLRSLNAWRMLLGIQGLIGQDANRYEGLGFGNLSCRTSHGFLITGSQTGHLPDLHLSNYAEVTGWSLPDNRLHARGRCRPSSESLSHAAAYAASIEVGCVFHVHSPAIWQSVDRLALPATDLACAYGTPAMAEAVRSIVLETPARGLLVMRGHEDGVLVWGESTGVAGNLLLHWLNRAASP